MGILLAVLLKRYRCRTCRKVFTMVPGGFYARHQTAAAKIVTALAARLRHQGWPIGIPRQRAGHWLRKFLAKCRMNHPLDDPLTILGIVAGGHLFV